MFILKYLGNNQKVWPFCLAIVTEKLWTVFDLDHDLANAIHGIYRVVPLPSYSHHQDYHRIILFFVGDPEEKKKHDLLLLLGGGTTQGIYQFFSILMQQQASTSQPPQSPNGTAPFFTETEMSQDLEEATKWVLETAVPLSGELSSSPLEDFWKALRRRKAWEILEHSSVGTIGHLRKTRTKERVKLWCPGPSWSVSFLRTSEFSKSLQVAILFHHHCLDQHILVVALCR